MTAKAKNKSIPKATLTLTIEYDDSRLLDVIEAAKEVVDKATEQGRVTGGYLEIHHTGRIAVEDLQ